MVYMIYNRSPFALIVKREQRDQHAEGSGRKKARRACRFCYSPHADPARQEERRQRGGHQGRQRCAQSGGADAHPGRRRRHPAFAATTYMNLVAQRQDPDKENCAGFSTTSTGWNLSQCVMVSQKLYREAGGGAWSRPRHQQGADRGRRRSQCRHGRVAESRAAAAAGDRRPRLIYFLEKQMITPETKALGSAISTRSA